MVTIIILALILFALLGAGGSKRSGNSHEAPRREHGGLYTPKGQDIRRRHSIGDGGEHNRRSPQPKKQSNEFSHRSGGSGKSSSGGGMFGGGGSRGGGAGRR